MPLREVDMRRALTGEAGDRALGLLLGREVFSTADSRDTHGR